MQASAAAKTGRKSVSWMIAALLIGGALLAIAHYAVGVKASDTVAAQRISFEGKDVITAADADNYAAKVLNVKLAAATSTTDGVETLLAQRVAIQKADNLSSISNVAETAYRAAFVAGALLLVGVAISIGREDSRKTKA